MFRNRGFGFGPVRGLNARTGSDTTDDLSIRGRRDTSGPSNYRVGSLCLSHDRMILYAALSENLSSVWKGGNKSEKKSAGTPDNH